MSAPTRLAKQFNKDPETLAAEILRAGLQAIDDSAADNCEIDLDPPYLSLGVTQYDLIHRYTVTGILESMSEDEIADAQREADRCNNQLQEIIRWRFTRGVNMTELQ